ncbi:MAG: hypothetical protein HFG65_06210 [Hungatella sp.]|nr:hypothetical protein [Hungatella sp.]
MKVSNYKKYGINMAQIWFCDDLIEAKDVITADIALFMETKIMCDKYKGNSKPFTTSVIDLGRSEDTILGGINKTVRYEIRRAGRENIRYQVYDSKEILSNKELVSQFEYTYNQMYKAKGLPDRLNKNRFYSYAKADMMVLTVAYKDNELLVFHSYIYGDKMARLYQSASCFRSNKEQSYLIGIANKGLHWHDITHFKADGAVEYDWGGISNPENPNGIDKFKLNLGGTIVTRYNVLIPLTIKGKIACYIKKF